MKLGYLSTKSVLETCQELLLGTLTLVILMIYPKPEQAEEDLPNAVPLSVVIGQMQNLFFFTLG